MITLRFDSRRLHRAIAIMESDIDQRFPPEIIKPAMKKGLKVAKKETPRAKPSKIKSRLKQGALKFKLAARDGGGSKSKIRAKANAIERKRLKAIGTVQKLWKFEKRGKTWLLTNTSRGAQDVATSAFQSAQDEILRQIEKKGKTWLERRWALSK